MEKLGSRIIVSIQQGTYRVDGQTGEVEQLISKLPKLEIFNPEKGHPQTDEKSFLRHGRG